MPVITAQEAARDFSPIFNGKRGEFLFNVITRVTGIAKVNSLYDRVEAAGIPPGPDFAKGILDEAGVDFAIGNPGNLDLLPEGAFIVVSNHNYGHLDGICLVDLIGHLRPQVKVMVNELLMYIRGLVPNFIAVNPALTGTIDATATSINGVRSALLQVRDGEPLCLFPAGAVTDLHPFRKPHLDERDWQDAAIRLIRKARVPVIPVRFYDRNSWFYYLLGLLDYRVRFVRLFHEVFNKRGTHPRLGVGTPISVEEQNRYSDLQDYKSFLRNAVYGLPLPKTFVNRSELWK